MRVSESVARFSGGQTAACFENRVGGQLLADFGDVDQGQSRQEVESGGSGGPTVQIRISILLAVPFSAQGRVAAHVEMVDCWRSVHLDPCPLKVSK